MTEQRWPGDPLVKGDPDRIGPYTVMKRLGAGGMGRIYLGRSPFGRLVAIKTIRSELGGDPGFRARFSQEVAAARRVSGVFTAAVVNADPDAAVPWLATAYVPAPSMENLIRECGPLSPMAVRWLAAGIAEALESVHAAGLVHRDLKPSNVLVAGDGPKVIDFGISRAADFGSLTMTGVAVGTPAYMSPEQAQGVREITSASDMFSLGATLVYAATAHSPYPDRKPAEALLRLVTGSPDLGGLPPELHELIGWCMQRQPEHRPTPTELLTWLAPQLDAEGDSSDADTRLPEAAAAMVERFERAFRPESVRRTPPTPEPERKMPSPEDEEPEEDSGGHIDPHDLGKLPAQVKPTAMRRPGDLRPAGSMVAASTDDDDYVVDLVKTKRKRPAGPPAVPHQQGPVASPPPASVAAPNMPPSSMLGGQAPLAPPARPPMGGVTPSPVPPNMPPPGVLPQSTAPPSTPMQQPQQASALSQMPPPQAPSMAPPRPNLPPAQGGGAAAAVQQAGPGGYVAAGPTERAFDKPPPPAISTYVGDGSDVPRQHPTPPRTPTGGLEAQPWRYLATGEITTPAVRAGSGRTARVHVHSSDNALHTLHLGTREWRYDSTGWSHPPAVDGDRMYLASQDHHVYALELTTRQWRWSFPTSGDVVAAPVVEMGTVYVASSDNALYAIEADTGRCRWRFPTGGWATQPEVHDGTVYFGSSDQHVYAVDAAGGWCRWRYATGGWVSAPTVAGGLVHVGSTDHYLYLLDAAAGTLRGWHQAHGPVAQPAAAGGMSYFGSADCGLYAVDTSTMQCVWRHQADGWVTSPAVAGGMVYAGSSDGSVIALGGDGALRWTYRTPGQVTSPVVADGLVFVGCTDRNLYVLDAATGRGPGT